MFDLGHDLSLFEQFFQVYEKTGVRSCKLTHHRSHCVMHASTEGLQPHQVSTLTKHQTDKLSQAYWCEMHRGTMSVMAGFGKGEAYFVPREKIELPFPVRECTDMLLGGDYSKWEAEQQAEDGDKSECGEMFFSRLIPFLIEVLVQDGIYFVHDFPNHQMAQILQVRRYLSLSHFNIKLTYYGFN